MKELRKKIFREIALGTSRGLYVLLKDISDACWGMVNVYKKYNISKKTVDWWARMVDEIEELAKVALKKHLDEEKEE